MARSAESAWNRVSAKLDVSQWDGVTDKMREWAADVSSRSDVLNRRVPLPIKHSPALYLSTGLLASTLRSRGGQIPPGTLALALAQTFVFLKPNGVSLNRVSLLPYRVVHKRELYRLLAAGFVHMDLTHALFNINSLVEAGSVLEPQMGAVPFLLDTAMITVVSHGLYVWAAWLEKSFLKRHFSYYTLDTVGFSSVAFGLNVLTGVTHGSDPNIVSSLPIPPAYHVWVQLVITTLCFQSSNHLGHLCGILAGLVRVFVPWPFVWIRRKFTRLFGMMLDMDIDNRIGEERKLKRHRTANQLLRHLGLFTTSVIVYLFKTRNRGQ